MEQDEYEPVPFYRKAAQVGGPEAKQVIPEVCYINWARTGQRTRKSLQQYVFTDDERGSSECYESE